VAKCKPEGKKEAPKSVKIGGSHKENYARHEREHVARGHKKGK